MNISAKNSLLIDFKTSQPIVSVIIPTHKRWEIICDAIESVIQQTFTDWEIVIVNDCGPPPYGRVIEFLKNQKINYIEHESKLGPSAARNTGIKYSSGKFLMYLDDDDILYPDHILKLVTALTENNWDIAYTEAYVATYRIIDNKQECLGKKVVYPGNFSLNDLWKDNRMPILNVMHRKTCLECTGNFDPTLRLLEDWDLWLRFSLYFQFNFVPAITTEYRIWENKTNTSQNTSNDEWMKAKCHIYLKYFTSLKTTETNNINTAFREATYFFLKRQMNFFYKMSMQPNTDSEILSLLFYATKWDWLRMFIKAPFTATPLILMYLRMSPNLPIRKHQSSQHTLG